MEAEVFHAWTGAKPGLLGPGTTLPANCERWRTTSTFLTFTTSTLPPQPSPTQHSARSPPFTVRERLEREKMEADMFTLFGSSSAAPAESQETKSHKTNCLPTTDGRDFLLVAAFVNQLASLRLSGMLCVCLFVS